MSFVKPAKGTPAVGSASRRPTHEAIAPGRERPLRGGPAEQRAPRHSSRDHAPTPLPTGAPAAPAAVDDSGHGLGLLTLTAGGSLAVVAAVALIALVPAVWVAAFAFVVLLALTGALLAAVLHATSS